MSSMRVTPTRECVMFNGYAADEFLVARGWPNPADRCHLDRWLHEVMGIQGISIPYGAPNASPHVERFMRTLRQEALDHFLFLTVAHLRRVVHAYVAYDNGDRPSQRSTRSLRRTRNSGPRHPPTARSSPCPSSAASSTTTGSQLARRPSPRRFTVTPIGAPAGRSSAPVPVIWPPRTLDAGGRRSPRDPSPLHRLHESPIAMSSRGLRVVVPAYSSSESAAEGIRPPYLTGSAAGMSMVLLIVLTRRHDVTDRLELERDAV